MKCPPNAVRVIAGAYRHRLLRFPTRTGLRPTSDRTRERLFNWLGSLSGYCCLDLFAGSGALGFEAASRGAKHVLMIEQDPTAVQYLLNSQQQLEAHTVTIALKEALSCLKKLSKRFDVIFLDPPFKANLLPILLDMVPHCLTQNGLVYIESERLPEGLENWQVIQSGKSRYTEYALLKFIATH